MAAHDEQPGGGERDALAFNASPAPAAATDLRLAVDWVRFRRPRLAQGRKWLDNVSTNPLIHASTPDSQVLALLGD